MFIFLYVVLGSGCTQFVIFDGFSSVSVTLFSPRSGPLSIWDFRRQSVFRRVPGRFLVGRVCSAMSRVDFRSAECVPPRPWSISGWQGVFRHVPCQFPVSRVCSAAARVDFWWAEGVPPRPGLISGWQSVFRCVPGQFPVFKQLFCGGICTDRLFVQILHS